MVVAKAVVSKVKQMILSARIQRLPFNLTKNPQGVRRCYHRVVSTKQNVVVVASLMMMTRVYRLVWSRFMKGDGVGKVES